MIVTGLTRSQIDALGAAQDHNDAYRLADADGNRVRGNRYKRAARTRVVQSLNRLGLVNGSQITDAGLLSLMRERSKPPRKPRA